MTSMPVWGAAAIEKIVAGLVASRPAYASILGFYGPVFTAQAKAAGDTSPPPISVDAADLHMRCKEGFALIEPASFTVDHRAAQKLLVEICGIAAVAGERLSTAGEALAASMNEGTDMVDLFGDALADKGRIQAFAEEKDVPSEMLTMLLYLALRPSIEAGVRQLSAYLEDDPDTRSGCPVCGRAPILGELDADGNQWLHCSLCWHHWPVKRMACLFCGNRGSNSLEYLYSEEEPEYRVYLCNSCRQYLKVVDTRKLKREFFPPLEQVVSLHLDIKVSEKGYAHAMGNGTTLP